MMYINLAKFLVTDDIVNKTVSKSIMVNNLVSHHNSNNSMMRRSKDFLGTINTTSKIQNTIRTKLNCLKLLIPKIFHKRSSPIHYLEPLVDIVKAKLSSEYMLINFIKLEEIMSHLFSTEEISKYVEFKKRLMRELSDSHSSQIKRENRSNSIN